MAGPTVSVVVPSYQQARFLRVAIDSVLSQDYEPIEVLVMDGGSTDGSVEILRSYGDRIWFCSAPDGGQSAAINAGFRRSRGDIVAWLNSDDFYYPGAVRTAVEMLCAEPDAAAVYGDGDLVDENGAVIRRFPETVPFELWRLCNVADYILQPTVFCRREPLFAGGLLDESLHWGLDWDLWMRLGAHARLLYTPTVLAASRIYGETKTATGGWKRLRELWRILRRYSDRRVPPAAVAHGITTLVRGVAPTQDVIAADALAQHVPRPARSAARSLLARVERGLRSWLENAQGIWADGMVGRSGQLWLPAGDGRRRLRIAGRNLDLRGQVVALRAGGSIVRTAALAPGEVFELELGIEDLHGPLKAQLTCAKTRRLPALQRGLKGRRAGCELVERRVS